MILLQRPPTSEPASTGTTSGAGLIATDLSPRRSGRGLTGAVEWTRRMPEVGRAKVLSTTGLFTAPAGAPLLDKQGFAVTLTYYRIQPAWLGDWQRADIRTVAIHDDRIQGGTLSGTYLEVQVPPDLPVPPFGIQVEITAHVADPVSGMCARMRDPEIWSVPIDDPDLGHLWCATRLVVEQWTPRLGSEGRPIDPTAPQLHRHPERGPNGACAGVGMSLLAFHMDPTQLVPVWLEVADGSAPGFRIVASFDPGFRAVLTPDLVIVDEREVMVARNGTIIDPDGRLDGHAICPTGRVVAFD